MMAINPGQDHYILITRMGLNDYQHLQMRGGCWPDDENTFSCSNWFADSIEIEQLEFDLYYHDKLGI